MSLGMLEINCPGKNISKPPGLVVKNRFGALAEGEEEQGMMIAGLEVWIPTEESVNEIVKEKPIKLISAGKGKITIDSGAADSVMPLNMLPNEEMKEGGSEVHRGERREDGQHGGEAGEVQEGMWGRNELHHVPGDGCG